MSRRAWAQAAAWAEWVWQTPRIVVAGHVKEIVGDFEGSPACDDDLDDDECDDD